MSINNSQEKILFVTRPLSPPWDEASKNFAYDLAKNLTGYDVTILVDEVMANVPPHITQEKIYTSNKLSLLQKKYLIKYLLQNARDFDMIHLLFTPTKLNSWILKKILKRKKSKIIQTIATLRDDLYSPTDLKDMFFGNVLVTYSQWAKEKLENTGFTNVAQIYPGIDLTRYTPKEKSATLLQKWNLKPTDKIIAYPGEFARLGATDLVIDAFINIWKDPANAHIKYLCACRIKNEADQKKKEEVIRRIEKAGYRDRVVFTDTFADVSALYNLADIIIFPVTSMAGKFDVPLAMVEPYACKKPVIASDLPLFSEFSSNDINAIIPAANSTALSNAITDLLKDPERQKMLGESACTFAHETFNITKIAKNYERIYKEL